MHYLNDFFLFSKTVHDGNKVHQPHTSILHGEPQLPVPLPVTGITLQICVTSMLEFSFLHLHITSLHARMCLLGFN